MRTLAPRVDFDLLLGGINLGASRPLGDAAQSRFDRLWKEVFETTGQTFSHRLPPDFVYNSTRPCIALHAFRSITGAPPFEFLHILQERFFVHGEDVTAAALLRDVASGELKVVIDRTFPLSEAAAAHEYIESRAAFGRVVLVP